MYKDRIAGSRRNMQSYILTYCSYAEGTSMAAALADQFSAEEPVFLGPRCLGERRVQYAR